MGFVIAEGFWRDFGGEENGGTGNTGFENCGAAGGFVAVGGGGVDLCVEEHVRG